MTTKRTTMADNSDDNSKFGQRPLSVTGTEERGQQVLPGSSSKPQAGQNTSKLIVPEMPLPPQPPAEDD